jgi:UDP:flavonoid glycosyltransferase YjiC (YdhE family)
VRVLFSFVGARGHLEPLVPLARVAQDAGHNVAFAASPSGVPTVEKLGFSALPIGPPDDDTPPRRIPLREVDLEREAREFRERFVQHGAGMRAPAVAALCAEWEPELVVVEETDYGALFAAERLGLPYATVLVLAAGNFVRGEAAEELLRDLRADHGLPPDPELAMTGRYLVLAPFPPSYRDPEHPLPATAHYFRPYAPPSPARDGDGPPTVYFTLGTVFNLESGDLFDRVIQGLRGLPVDVVATVGPHIDAAEEFGPLPDNFRVEQYIPQAEILPRASVVVSHGGSGSVLGALAHGLPQVLIPIGADQPLNGARCEELGVAIVLDPIAATPETVREAVSMVLSDPAYRTAAERLRDEFRALPGPEHALTLLEELAREKRSMLHAD